MKFNQDSTEKESSIKLPLIMLDLSEAILSTFEIEPD